jgi:glycosyltransferase involved in cell wall biosynthesis
MRTLIVFGELYSSFDRGERFGLLRRNMAQYEKFLQRKFFDAVCLYTYDPNDHARLAELKAGSGLHEGIRVITAPPLLRSRAGSILYSVIGPLLHWRVLADASAFRTQQVSGAWTALIAKAIFRKPLLFRVGYPLSQRFEKEGKRLKYMIARSIEWALVRFADRVAVSSTDMQKYYGDLVPGATVTHLPSYVDFTDFTPIADYSRAKPLLFVGRLDPVKNIENLIVACARLKVPLVIYGFGPLEDDLKALARETGADVAFKGVVANSELLRRHHDHTIYVLCSVREGMPKSLIEAMASGLICVGTKVSGIMELIEDGRTGYLIDGFDADAIEQRLRWVLDNFDPEVGRHASAIVHRNNSLDRAIELESELLDGITRVSRSAETARSVAQ